MSKRKVEGNVLPRLQKRILLYLAEREPQTINETVETISEYYRSSWIAFRALEKKRLIQKVGNKTYHSKDYACFWLTAKGMIIALTEGAKRTNLLKRAAEVYSSNAVAHNASQAVYAGGKGFNEMITAVLNKNKMNHTDMTAIVALHLQFGISQEQLNHLIAVTEQFIQQQNSINHNVNVLRLSPLKEVLPHPDKKKESQAECL